MSYTPCVLPRVPCVKIDMNSGWTLKQWRPMYRTIYAGRSIKREKSVVKLHTLLVECLGILSRHGASEEFESGVLYTYMYTYAGSKHPKNIKKNTVLKLVSLLGAYLGVLSRNSAT